MLRVFTRWSCRLIRQSLPTASSAKLLTHFDTLTEAYGSTGDWKRRIEIVNTQRDIAQELLRRGYRMPGWDEA